MDDLFRVLSRKEFDGLSLDEKLAYLDLDLLAAIYGRNKKMTTRPSPRNSAASRNPAERRPRPGP